MNLQVNISNQIFLFWQLSNLNTGRSKPIISPFVTGYHILQHMFNKFIHLMLFCTFWVSTIAKKAIIHIYNTISKTITATPNAISNWINKPRIRYTNKWSKTSHGARKYSNNLRASKNSGYNNCNCKSGRHAWRHTFMKHKGWTKPSLTNKSYPDLKIKSRKLGTSKPPPPWKRDWMLYAISCRKNRRNNIDNNQYVLSYNKPDLCNNYILIEQGSIDRFSINFRRHCVLVHALLDTNPLDEVDSWKEVVQPTKKPRSVDPRKLKPIQTLKKTTKSKKTHQRNKKSRSVTIQVPEDRKNKNK